jgi:hypothetical protein
MSAHAESGSSQPDGFVRKIHDVLGACEVSQEGLRLPALLPATIVRRVLPANRHGDCVFALATTICPIPLDLGARNAPAPILFTVSDSDRTYQRLALHRQILREHTNVYEAFQFVERRGCEGKHTG